MGVRIGNRQNELISFLALNPKSRNVDIMKALKVKKGNVAKMLVALGKDGKKLVIRKEGTKSPTYRASLEGIGRAVTNGCDLIQVFEKNKGYYPMFTKWLIIDRELSMRTKFWGEDKIDLVPKMLVIFDKLEEIGTPATGGAYSGAVTGVFQNYFESKLKSKQISKKNYAKLMLAIIEALGGMRKVAEESGLSAFLPETKEYLRK